MTLAQIKPGHGGVIATVEGEGALRRHLLDMGLTPGTKVMVRKVAPMGDPMAVSYTHLDVYKRQRYPVFGST